MQIILTPEDLKQLALDYVKYSLNIKGELFAYSSDDKIIIDVEESKDVGD